MNFRQGLARGTLQCAAVGLAAVLVAATAVRAAALEAEARSLLAFDLHPPRGTWPEAAQVALRNGSLAVSTLLSAGLVRRVPSTRLTCDGVLAALATLNAAALGVAFGGYGLALLPSVVSHLPFELAAFSLAGSAYLMSRRAPFTGRRLALPALGSAALVLMGALAETYVRPGGGS